MHKHVGLVTQLHELLLYLFDFPAPYFALAGSYGYRLLCNLRMQ